MTNANVVSAKANAIAKVRELLNEIDDKRAKLFTKAEALHAAMANNPEAKVPYTAATKTDRFVASYTAEHAVEAIMDNLVEAGRELIDAAKVFNARIEDSTFNTADANGHLAMFKIRTDRVVSDVNLQEGAIKAFSENGYEAGVTAHHHAVRAWQKLYGA